MTFRVLLLFTLTLTYLASGAVAECTPPSPLSIPALGNERNTPPIGANLIAQTFVAPGAGCMLLQSVQVQALGDSPLGSLVVTIYTVDGAGKPAAATGASASIPLFDSGGAYVPKTAIFATPVQLSGGVAYAVVFSQPATTNGSHHYDLRSMQKPGGGPYFEGKLWVNSSPKDNEDVLMTLTFGCCPTGCTYSHGYWKNHPEFWPATALTLGSVSYTREQGVQILNQSVVGNGLISLAHQLIAAKLNILAGAPQAPISATISAADALIGSLTVPPAGSGYLQPSLTASLDEALDHYNNGVLPGGPPHCQD